MPTFEIAHILEQGNNMIIIPLDSSFGSKGGPEQQRIIAQLQFRSRAAGLAGTVVPVWDTGGGQMAFIAPNQWHSFFKSIDFQWIGARINKKLSW